MFKKIFPKMIYCLVLGILGLAGCGGDTNNNPGTAGEALAQGLDAFRARDLVGARDAFCKELADEPNDSKLAFGCFWAKWMLLPTTQQAATLLAAFDEDPITANVQYYGPTGIFTLISEVDRGPGDVFPQFNYNHFVDLPFADFTAPGDTLQATLL
ncbi:MAG TPA: hypothetical protein DF383_13515, partial [Deltaproteobacteria bacterium]|nr:hypothetical protein [Deltaproteobacteria bacterium]